MLNKSMVLISFLCAINELFSQQIVLHKNGTNKIYKLGLKQKVTLIYKSDSCLINTRVKLMNYKFPLMVVKTKTKTFDTLDVRKIVELTYKSQIAGIYYTGAVLVTTFVVPIIVISIKEKIYDAAFFAAFPLGLSYLFFQEAKRTFNTNNKWHFE